MELHDIIQKAGKKHIYIYGAGKVGKMLLKAIKEETTTEVAAFIISGRHAVNETVNGVPVFSIDEINEKENIYIIVATMKKFREEIKKTLEDYDINDYYVLSDDLIQKIYVYNKDRKASLKLRVNEMLKLSMNSIRINSILIVSDYEKNINIPGSGKIELVSSTSFINGKYSTENAALILCLLIDWSTGVEVLLQKLFATGAEILLSFGYEHLETRNFNFFETMKAHGYQLSGFRRFYRSPRENNKEDVLMGLTVKNPSGLWMDMLCTGCGKCVQDCPGNALKLSANNLGFYKPFLNKEKCIECGICISDCPVHNFRSVKGHQQTLPECYAFMAQDDIRMTSSSGGAFYVLAYNFIQEGGYVCGAAWNEDFSVSHILIDRIEDIPKLQRSKYVRSDINEVLPQIGQLLLQNKSVMFVGCPCQVAALKHCFKDSLDKLLTVDLICSEAPSHKLFCQYLEENYDVNNIKEMGFREKSKGWRHDSFYIIDKDNNIKIKDMEDYNQTAFHNRIMMYVHCEHCCFSYIPRQGDLTLADFWGIDDHDPGLNDKKGISAVMVTTEKGKSCIDVLYQNAKIMKSVPFRWLEKNRIGNGVKPHRLRDWFYSEVQSLGFNKAVCDAYEGKFDVGLVGNWSYPNYGSELTNFALYSTIKKLGYSVLMIEWPEDSEWKPYGATQLFEREPYDNYEIAYPAENQFDMKKYNDLCRMFVQGSDQLMNPYLYKVFGKNVVLSWVDPSKKKIGYSLSFGASDVSYTEADKNDIRFYLDKFAGISVRENTAVDIMKNMFGIDSKWTLDPVFLCDKDIYEKLASTYMKNNPDEKLLFSYLLDPTDKTAHCLNYIANKKKLKLNVIADAVHDTFLYEQYNIDVLKNPSVEMWLASLINSNFVITDSFHGICFSIIFNKDFIAVCNKARGATRFTSLLGLLGLKDRLVDSIDEIESNPSLFGSIEYESVNQKLKEKKDEALHWLEEQLKNEHQVKYSDEYRIINDRFNKIEKMLNELMKH